MNTQSSSREVAQRRRKRRLLRRGQSLVEYALTLALMALVAQGTMRTVYKSVATVVTNLRSSLNSADDRTPTPGPSPTVRFPPDPPTLTALPATATVLAKCTVPDLSNSVPPYQNPYQYQAAVAEWINYGFSAGTLSKPSGKTTNFVVGSQSLTAGASVFCTSTMTVDAKHCTVPYLKDQVFSAARAGAWTTSGFFTDNLVPPNKVTDTAFPIGNQQYAADSTVDCDVTMQVDPKMCKVPPLSGTTFNISGVGTAHTTWNASFIAANLTRQAGEPDTFTVGDQSLAVGNDVYCNTPMEVWRALCQVPNVVDSTYANAVTAWTNKGFTTALQKIANTPAAFTITSQSQTATTILDCNSAIMTVQPNMCTVPSNLVGLSVAAARTAWTTAGFTLGNLTLNPTTALSGWDVTTLSPLTSGTQAACATSSNTFAAQSPLNVTVTVDRASGKISKSGQAPVISATAYNTDVPTGARGIDYVVFTISKSGTTYTIRVNAGSGTTYCAFGGSCSIWTALTASSNPARTAVPAWASALTGTYTITATAYSTDMTNIGSQVSAPVTFTIQ